MTGPIDDAAATDPVERLDLDHIEAGYARFRGDGATRTKAVNDVLALVDEVHRLRAEVETWRSAVERAADDGAGICDCGLTYLDGAEQHGALVADRARLADRVVRVEGERDRLADAIRTHRDALAAAQPLYLNRKLWAALDQEDHRA